MRSTARDTVADRGREKATTGIKVRAERGRHIKPYKDGGTRDG